jgi:hypothetical protein
MVVNTLRPVTRFIHPPSPRWVSFASGFLHTGTETRRGGVGERRTAAVPGYEKIDPEILYTSGRVRPLRGNIRLKFEDQLLLIILRDYLEILDL